MRSASARSGHMYEVKSQVIQKLQVVVSGDGDPSTSKPGRSAVAGPIRNDHPYVETVVGIFMRVPRVPRSWHLLKPQEGTTVGRTVLAPSQGATVAQDQASFAHGIKYLCAARCPAVCAAVTRAGPRRDKCGTRTNLLNLARVRAGVLACSFLGSPNGVRTRVSTLRGWCPRPLDDGTAGRVYPGGLPHP
jgi:hypothetical protein